MGNSGQREEPGLSVNDQSRLDYEAGQQLARDYFSATHTLGSLIITFASGIFAASIGLLDEVAPLDQTTLDWVLVVGWVLLALTVFTGVVFLVLGGLTQRAYLRQLMLLSQSTREGDVSVMRKRGEEARKHLRSFSLFRDVALGAMLVWLMGALISLGSYVAISTSEGTEASNVIVNKVAFTEDIRNPGDCLATLDLKIPDERANLTIYTAVNGALTPLAQQETLVGTREARICVPVPETLEGVETGSFDVEILADKSPEILSEELSAGQIDIIRGEAELSAPYHYWIEPP